MDRGGGEGGRCTASTHGGRRRGVLLGGPMTGDCWLQQLANMWRPTSKEIKTGEMCLYLDVRVLIESREICFPPGKFISRELTSLVVRASDL